MTNERRSNADYLQEIWDSLEGVWDKSKYNMEKGYDDEYGCECITISLRDNEDVRAKIYVEDHEGQHPTGFEVVYRYPGDKGVGIGGYYEFQSTDMDGLGEEVFDYFDEIKNKVGESMKNEGKNEVSNFSRDSLGVSFDGKFGNMRKGESWVVYPETLDKGYICIQGDTRFGYINVNKGFLVLSAPHSTPIYAALMVDINKGKAQRIPLEKEIVDQILNAVNDRTITDHSLDNVIRNADVTDDELKGEAKQTEATKKYYGYGKDDVIDKEDTDFMWQVAYDWFEDRLPERLKGKADSAVYKVIDKDSRAYEEILTMDDYHDYLQKYGPGVIKDITANDESKKSEAEGSLVELIDKVDNMFHYHNKNLNNYQYNTIDDLLEVLKSKDTNKIKGAISNLDNLVHYRNKNLNNSQYYLLDELLEALQKKYMKSDEAKQCEDVQYYYDRLNPTEKEKFNGLSEQIETLVGMYDENGELSKPQQDQLKELRDAIYVFGYVARGYVSFADEVLANYGVEPLIDSKEPVFDEARQPAEYSVHSYNDTDIQHYEDGTPEEWRCPRCGGWNGGEDGEPFGKYITDSNGKVVIRLLCSGCADDACDILNATHGNVRKAIGLGESKKSEDKGADTSALLHLQTKGDGNEQAVHEFLDDLYLNNRDRLGGFVRIYSKDLGEVIGVYADSKKPEVLAEYLKLYAKEYIVQQDMHDGNWTEAVDVLPYILDCLQELVRNGGVPCKEQSNDTLVANGVSATVGENGTIYVKDRVSDHIDGCDTTEDAAKRFIALWQKHNLNQGESKKSEDASDPMVIYKEGGIYRTTPKSNYDARIQNAFRIQKWDGFDTPQEIIDYCTKYSSGFDPDNVIIVESKKSESLTLKQKELKDMARFGQAEDITTISDAEAKELKKKGIETVGISRGVYGMNGALLRDNEGNKYVITARSSNLFYFV